MKKPAYFDTREGSANWKGATGPFWTGYEELEKIMPGISSLDVNLSVPARMLDGHVNRDELCLLAAIAKYIEPASVFEFGTFDGLATLNFVMNMPESSRIYTLDLPDGHTQTVHPQDGFNQKYLPHSTRRRRFENSPYWHKIEQIKMDSANLDAEKFARMFDLIFVDGSHTYEYCKNDTDKALQMVSENGIILWHDYNGNKEWTGVTEYLNYLAREKGLMLYWLFNKDTDLQTCLVMHCNGFMR